MTIIPRLSYNDAIKYIVAQSLNSSPKEIQDISRKAGISSEPIKELSDKLSESSRNSTTNIPILPYNDAIKYIVAQSLNSSPKEIQDISRKAGISPERIKELRDKLSEYENNDILPDWPINDDPVQYPPQPISTMPNVPVTPSPIPPVPGILEGVDIQNLVTGAAYGTPVIETDDNIPTTPTTPNLENLFAQYLEVLSNPNQPIVSREPIPNILSDTQMLALKTNYEPLWRIEPLPNYQKLEILKTWQQRLRYNLERKVTNENQRKTKQKRSGSLRKQRKAGKRTSTPSTFY